MMLPGRSVGCRLDMHCLALNGDSAGGRGGGVGSAFEGPDLPPTQITQRDPSAWRRPR